MPDYAALFASVGISLSQTNETGYFGASVNKNTISDNALIDTPAYNSGLEKGDVILSVNSSPMDDAINFADFLKTTSKGDVLNLRFSRFRQEKKTTVQLAKDPTYSVSINQEANTKAVAKRALWLKQ